MHADKPAKSCVSADKSRTSLALAALGLSQLQKHGLEYKNILPYQKQTTTQTRNIINQIITIQKQTTMEKYITIQYQITIHQQTTTKRVGFCQSGEERPRSFSTCGHANFQWLHAASPELLTPINRQDPGSDQSPSGSLPGMLQPRGSQSFSSCIFTFI